MDSVQKYIKEKFNIDDQKKEFLKIKLHILTKFPRKRHVFEGGKSKGYAVTGETSLAMISFKGHRTFVAGTIYDHNEGDGLRFELHKYFETEAGHIRIEGTIECVEEYFLEIVSHGTI